MLPRKKWKETAMSEDVSYITITITHIWSVTAHTDMVALSIQMCGYL